MIDSDIFGNPLGNDTMMGRFSTDHVGLARLVSEIPSREIAISRDCISRIRRVELLAAVRY